MKNVKDRNFNQFFHCKIGGENILNYYVLEKTNECKDFYFENEGIFNFWNTYLIVHLKSFNIVLINRTNKIFHGERLSEDEKNMLRKEIKENYCEARKCKIESIDSWCDLVKEWGTLICEI